MIAAVEIVLLATLAYAWIGYPLVLAAIVRLGAARRTAPTSALPGSVSFLFSAHNEEEHMAARLDNLLHAVEELRPSGVRSEILAGVDGSDDRTARIARSLAAGHAEIRVFESRERRGKMRVVKDLVAAAQSDVLVLTDANTFFRPGSTARLLRHFTDPAIGGVCGRLVLKGRNQVSGGGEEMSGDRGQGTGRPAEVSDSVPSIVNRPSSIVNNSLSPETSYWNWEAHLKLLESDLDSCLGANGAIYAIRRELFWKNVPDNTVVDDFVIGMKVREAGRRMVYEPAAVAEEELPALAHEWRRRVRIGAGDFQALSFCGRCLLPRYGFFAWMFLSHKVLRWFTPHFMVAAVLLAILHCSLFIVHCPLFLPSIILLAGSLAGLSAWAMGRLARAANPARRGLVSLLLLWELFVTMQAALFVGSLRYMRGDLKGHWTRTPRGGV